MKYCCYIWMEVAQSSLLSLDRIQKHLHSLMGHKLFSSLSPFPIEEMTQIYFYSIAISMANVQIRYVLVIPVQTFTARTHYAIYTGFNHSHPLYSIGKKEIPLIFFLIAITLWNRLLKGWFPDRYNHNLLGKLISVLHILIICTSSSYTHSTSFSNLLTWVALGPCIDWIFYWKKNL